MILKVSFIAAVVTCLSAFNSPKQESIVFDKLVGIWSQTSGNNFEKWVALPGNQYNIKVFSVKNNDTIWKEDGRVYIEGKKWIFRNQVKGQNGELPVVFRATMITKDEVEFVNPDHDFPQIIHYTVRDTVLHAYIAGRNNKGTSDTIHFYYRRLTGFSN